jgi:uncharacterized protein YxjI
MKKTIFVLWLLTSLTTVFGQAKTRFLGKWQAEQAQITSMYHDSYEFLNDGRFIFKPDEYNGLNRIISINGIYELKSDTLILTPQFTKELVGGQLIRSETTTLSDTWEIVGGKERRLVITKKIKQSAIIKQQLVKKTLTLDGRKFFKVDL